uniref:PFU domain-containing protein n=1 Tax=Macrostomum lignano TaxID=282301 RepID=A0A1I8FNS7_9PLAT
WQKVGDVVGGEGGETVNSGGGGSGGCGSGGQTRFEGQDYDFVFTVDILGSLLKRFIDKHLLPQAYLDQVAQFIRTNAGETPTISQGTYADPYTGSGRYIPGSGTSDGGTGGGFSDPFTGGNRYVPGGAGLEAALAADEESPRELKANCNNMAGLRKKLGELAASVPADLPDRLGALVESGISQGDSADARLILSIADTALNGVSDCSLPCCLMCCEWLADFLWLLRSYGRLISPVQPVPVGGSSRPSARVLQLTGCSNCCTRMLAKAGSALKDEPAFLVVVSVGNLLLTRPGSAVRAKDLGFEAAAAPVHGYQLFCEADRSRHGRELPVLSQRPSKTEVSIGPCRLRLNVDSLCCLIFVSHSFHSISVSLPLL